MFRVKMLFSTVSISNRKYCLDICTLPGNWAMMGKQSCIFNHFCLFVLFFSLILVSGGVGFSDSQQRGQGVEIWRRQAIKVDFFALLYIVD